MPPKPVDFAIIGGGLSGIACSLKLRAAGCSTLLLESQNRLGGKVGLREVGGLSFETGPTMFTGSRAVVWELLELLGLSEAAFPIPKEVTLRYVVRKGRMRPLQPSPLFLARCRALSWAEKWEIVREAFRPPSPPLGEEETVEAFCLRRFGPHVTHGVVSAMLSGIFATTPAKLGLLAALPALSQWEKEAGGVLKGVVAQAKQAQNPRNGLWSLHKGMAQLGLVAQQQLACWTHAEVQTLSFNNPGFCLRVLREGQPLEVCAKAVCLATEADAAAQLLKPFLPEAAQTLHAFSHAPLAMVHWSETCPKQSRLPKGIGFLACAHSGMFSLGTLFLGNYLKDGRGPRFVSFVGGTEFPQRVFASEAQMHEGLQGDLRQLTGGEVGQVDFIQRWPKAIGIPGLGHLQKIDKLHACLQAFPLALAGSYCGASAMHDAISSGFEAAKVLQQKFLQTQGGTP
ncbi:MAG: protoporphyrinogen oxidase [Proteobacteria bacterium]|nr:protoporphyrinogen oxidase [Pseudomonadota bacterium]